MNTRLLSIGLVALVAALSAVFLWQHGTSTRAGDAAPSAATSSFSSHEAGFEQARQALQRPTYVGHDDQYALNALENWQRPPGPPRVGLQVGHLRNDDVPDELSQLTANGPGAVWGNLTEREVVREIVERAAERLRQRGVQVDVLPTTVPPGYVADAFVSVHGDGNDNSAVRGYKTAHFSNDYSGQSQYLEEAVASHYASSTGLPQDSNVTYYMTGYYAFNWWRYEHAVHPMTPSMILEMGFLTNAADRAVIVQQPAEAAEGIVDGVLAFLDSNAAERATRQTIILPEPPFTGTYQCLQGERDANDPPDAAQQCRPGLIASSSQATSRVDADSEWQRRYGFVFADDADTRLLGTITAGTRVRVSGAFTPMVEVRDLSWYDYQVRGTISVEDVEVLEAK
jgi:hypothetical protein